MKDFDGTMGSVNDGLEHVDETSVTPLLHDFVLKEELMLPVAT